MLHLVTSRNALADALAASTADDDVVLMHAAVLVAIHDATVPSALADALSGRRVHAMSADLAARGLDPAGIRVGIAVTDDAGLVALALRHPQSLTWS